MTTAAVDEAPGRADPDPAAARLLDGLRPLLSLGARCSRREPVELLALGDALLSPPDGADGSLRGGRSELNGDGCPLQLCVTSSAEGNRTRVIADPAWWHGDPGPRLEASRRVLGLAMRRCGAAELEPLADRLFEAFDPNDRAVLSSFDRGFVWIGAGVDGPGVAVYLDARPFGRDGAWDKARWWLGDTEAVQRCVQSLRRHATVASLGFEGAAPARAVAKLYFRLDRPVRLGDLGVEPLADPALAVFLAKVIGLRHMDLSGTVFSLGFDLATGTVADAKVDLCGHCLPRPAAEWAELFEDLAETFGLRQVLSAGDLVSGKCDVAFVGFGTDRRERHRLNVYLRPSAEKGEVTPENRRDRLRAACRTAVGNLLDLQHGAGRWEDYRLPVGSSTQWVTGFAGLALARIAAVTDDAAARSGAEAAARRLLEHRDYAAGWGFNGRTGADADSTAVVIRLLRALELPVERRDERWLLERWRPEGGFATYEGPGYWGAVHPCVTAMAVPALAESDLEGLRGGLTAYLRRTVRPDGTWPAYWWRSHYYSTFHHLLLLRRLGMADSSVTPPALDLPSVPETPTHLSAFETAYAAGIAWLTGEEDRADALLTGLLARQRFDGGWSGAPNLRVTEPDCAEPWESPRGRLYADQRGVITTASVLLVLAEILGGGP